MSLFYEPNPQQGFLSEEESVHAFRVLRLKEGDMITLMDGRGGWYEARITKAHAKKTEYTLIQTQVKGLDRSYHLHLAIAPTKNLDRMEWLVEKAVEFGIDEITFLLCHRSERRHLSVERMEKIALSAAKQSLKAHLPIIHPLTPLDKFLQQEKVNPEEQRFIAHLVEGERKSLTDLEVKHSRARVLIGPEGDFSPEEITLAQKAGFQSITLGPSRLRTETAGLAVVNYFYFKGI